MGRQKRSVQVDEMPVELRTPKATRSLRQRIKPWFEIAAGLATLAFGVVIATGHYLARHPLLALLVAGGVGGTLVVEGVRLLRRGEQNP